MSSLGKAAAAAAVFFAGLLAWGYWHGASHATLYIRVEDEGVDGRKTGYEPLHNVGLDLYDSAGSLVARAHSIEPHGHIAAIHPDPAVGDCRQFERPQDQQDYRLCFRRHSAWAAAWLESVRTARVNAAGCAIAGVPVRLDIYNSDWWLWWLPLPHVGGTPYRHGSLLLRIDSRSCTALPPPAG